MAKVVGPAGHIGYLGHFAGEKVLREGHNRVSKSRRMLGAAMREVHTNEPSTVRRAKVSGKRKESMRQAIAFNKARKAGARLPRKGSY